ncbi:biopolymer transporter ExbB [Saccharobesus litoralis]|uniref:Biopolymer transporter ExbB n=1 Tax=Saccharobesus litoralis TaxID=2172099 RepID=A0A2S0VUL4_9ALTE|nr:MotA/TolQ/ExbB proton channel family protein [Saccharobesus litoralis]AWB67911.1 biopolymer transporter ExbB [Saccharobesus litoralis]
MLAFWEMFEAVRGFMETGGQVLTLIAGLIFIMWIVILERIGFAFNGYKRVEKQIVSAWNKRDDHSSWEAHQIREAQVSRASIKLNQHIAFLGALVALCPLLGLLGTVTGMIEVFDVMAISGSGSARSMASGVSKATIPTMAGMVGALSGIFALTWLQRNAKRQVELLEDHLEVHR